MLTIQQSIEIKVPVHTAYNQLTLFENYPRFMEEVETVEQLDDTHLHWKTIMSNRAVEWDAEITEQELDRCIAWHNISGPTHAGKLEVQSAGPDASRVIFTLQAEPQQVPGSPSGNSEEEMALRLKMDLARLKEFIESRGSGTAAQGGEVHDAQVTADDRGAAAQRGQSPQYQHPLQFDNDHQTNDGYPPASAPGYAAASHDRLSAEESPAPAASDDAGAAAASANESTQSDYSLSKSADSPDDGRFTIAAEVNLDQQSDAVRHVGQMPQDTSADHHGGMGAADAMGKAMQPKADEKKKRS